jgi:GT2 family glycosyltransferase
VDDSGKPALSVIVSTYSRRDLLGDCLEALREAVRRLPEPAEVVVVDDGRQPGINELLAERFPEASLATTAGDLGFAGAVMEGIRLTRADWIVVLNDDVIVDSGALICMLEAGRSAPDIGSVASQMRFAGQPGTINSAGIEMNTLATPCDRLVGAPIDASEREPVDVFGACAGAGLFRRAMLAEIGGFDVTFFAYLDDVDVAWRARMHGWRCLYAPGAVVYHEHSATFGHRSGLKHFLTGRNRVRLVAKNAHRGHLRRYGLSMVIYDVAYVAYIGLRQRTLQPARGRLRGLREWKAFRRAGSAHRRPVALAKQHAFRSALRRDRAWPQDTSRQ